MFRHLSLSNNELMKLRIFANLGSTKYQFEKIFLEIVLVSDP